MRPAPPRHRAGFTLLEVSISLVIFALLAVNIQIVTQSGATAARSGALRSSLENELELTLDRITFALMSAKDSEIEGPVPAPLSSSFVRFASVIGHDEGGNVMMSATEQISWAAHAQAGSGESSVPTRDGGRVTWTENADIEVSRRVTWSNSVPSLYMGEIEGNARDDNGNDLLDEPGLAFARDGAQVQVFLTVERLDERGERRPVERSLRIAPRN